MSAEPKDAVRVKPFSYQPSKAELNRPQFAGGSKVSMDGAYGKK